MKLVPTRMRISICMETFFSLCPLCLCGESAVIAQHYTRAQLGYAGPREMPLFCHIWPAAFHCSDPILPHIGASMACVQIARQLLEDDMKMLSNRSWAAAQGPAFSMARDVLRIVIAAVLAGTGFALLLALTVLSLTVIAPPAHASGASAPASSDADLAAGSPADKPANKPAVVSWCACTRPGA